MKALRRINNNVAVCEDNAGNELVAMGKGIGFGKLPRELALSEVERTFYNVDPRCLSAISEISSNVLDFSLRISEYIRNELSYRLSPNLAFTLADHLSFAIERANKHLNIKMPLAADVEQTYPNEYRVARHIVRRARRELGAPLADSEIAGVAMSIVGARAQEPSAEELAQQQADEEMLEDVTEIIEDSFGVTLDRSSFAYSRYATHMRYLFDRLHKGGALDSAAVAGFQGIEEQFPQGVQCVDRIVSHIESTWDGAKISDDEKLFLVLHVSRVCIKGTGN